MTFDTDWFDAQFRDRGRNQADLARHLGIDASAITKVKKGARQWQPRELSLLAEFFEVSISEIFTRAGIALNEAPARFSHPADEAEAASNLFGRPLMAESIEAVTRGLLNRDMMLPPREMADAILLTYKGALDQRADEDTLDIDQLANDMIGLQIQILAWRPPSPRDTNPSG